jgi:hypothetical protein
MGMTSSNTATGKLAVLGENRSARINLITDGRGSIRMSGMLS